MKTCICCLIKNTPKYLMELYCDHHLNKIGFDHIYFCIDKNSDFVKFIKDDRVTYIDIDSDITFKELYKYNKMIIDAAKDNKQILLYNWFLDNYKNIYDWIAFIDDDEFINLDLNILNDFKDYSALCLAWRLRNNIRMKKEENIDGYYDLTLDEFIRNFKNESYHKCIVNASKCSIIHNDHYADLNCKDFFKNTVIQFNQENLEYKFNHLYFNHDECKDIYNLIYNKNICIDHYYIRSFEEWVERIYDRGDNYLICGKFLEGVTLPNRLLIHYYEKINKVKFIDKVFDDLKSINREDVILKIKQDPILYGFGLVWSDEFYEEYTQTQYYEDFIKKYSKEVIEKFMQVCFRHKQPVDFLSKSEYNIVNLYK